MDISKTVHLCRAKCFTLLSELIAKLIFGIRIYLYSFINAVPVKIRYYRLNVVNIFGIATFFKNGDTITWMVKNEYK